MKIEHVYTHNECGPILDEADNIVDCDPIEKNNWISFHAQFAAMPCCIKM